MELDETFTDCALDVSLYVAKTLGADGKYFWVIFNFFWLGENRWFSRDFRTFFGGKTLFSGVQMLIKWCISWRILFK